VKTYRRVALVACFVLLVASLASLASADTVKCTPVLNTAGKVIGYCFEVCNKLEDPCTEAGCIYDFHISILGRCKAKQIKSLPPGWTGVISADQLGVGFATPPPTGGEPNPIKPGQCKRFCIFTECSSEGCFSVNWWTTARDGKVLDQGQTRCCPPPPPNG